jgi:hypothetical protein
LRSREIDLVVTYSPTIPTLANQLVKGSLVDWFADLVLEQIVSSLGCELDQ